MKGLINLGNTCYLNAGLQMLIQNKDLCNLILQKSEILNSNENIDNLNSHIINEKIMQNNNTELNILKKIGLFILNYYNNNNNPISPHEIKEILKQRQEIFADFSQQDSTEFILYFLNIIDDELIKINKLFTIDKLFGIEFNVRIKCKLRTCLTINNIKEFNNFLILNIEDDDNTLDDLYFNFKTSNKLEGDNLYYCDKCKEKRIASKRTNIETIPNHLFIWIKRFTNGPNFISKNCKLINFPLIWKNNMTLKGFIIHYGNINGGHYIYISIINNNWLIFDDSSIINISVEQMIQMLPNAYWLYYSL